MIRPTCIPTGRRSLYVIGWNRKGDDVATKRGPLLHAHKRFASPLSTVQLSCDCKIGCGPLNGKWNIFAKGSAAKSMGRRLDKTVDRF